LIFVIQAIGAVIVVGEIVTGFSSISTAGDLIVAGVVILPGIP